MQAQVALQMDSHSEDDVVASTNVPVATLQQQQQQQQQSPISGGVETILLIGPFRNALLPLLRKLRATYPVPPEVQQLLANSPPSSRYIYMYGQTLRLVFIDTNQESQRELRGNLVSRVLRHNPSLVLLCADFFDVASFEAVWGLDMCVLDSLDVDVMWVLVRSFSSTLRAMNAWHRSHMMTPPPVITQSHVRLAKRSIRSDRECVVVSLFGGARFIQGGALLGRASNSADGGRTGWGRFRVVGRTGDVADRVAGVSGSAGTGARVGVGVGATNGGGYARMNIRKLAAVIQQHLTASRHREARRGRMEAAQASPQQQQQEHERDQGLQYGRGEGVVVVEVVNGRSEVNQGDGDVTFEQQPTGSGQRATQSSASHGNSHSGVGGIAEDGDNDTNNINSSSIQDGPDETVDLDEHVEEATAGHDDDTNDVHVADSINRVDADQGFGADASTPSNTGTRARSLAAAYSKVGSLWNRLVRGLGFRRPSESEPQQQQQYSAAAVGQTEPQPQPQPRQQRRFRWRRGASRSAGGRR